MRLDADFVGRVDRSHGLGTRVDFPGLRIRLRFVGSTLRAHVHEWPESTDSRSHYRLRVDGCDAGLFVPAEGEHRYTLLDGLAPGRHEVEIFRRTEAQYGTTAWLGLDAPGGLALPPPPRRTRRLMVAGDSMCTGYGIEGRRGVDRGGATNQNAALAFPELLAEHFGAEVYNCSNSDTYLLPQPGSEGAPWPAVLRRSLAWGRSTQWDPAGYQPQVMLVMVGNDWTQPAPGVVHVPALARYQPAYEALLLELRADHPSTHIVCALSPAVRDGWPAGHASFTEQRGAVHGTVAHLRARGDHLMHYFEFERSGDDDLVACEWHPGVALHRSMARQLVAEVTRVTGWQPAAAASTGLEVHPSGERQEHAP